MLTRSWGLQVDIDPSVVAMHALPSGQLFIRTAVFGDGTFTARLSPPLWRDGQPVEPPDISEWPEGLYGADGLLIAETGD